MRMRFPTSTPQIGLQSFRQPEWLVQLARLLQTPKHILHLAPSDLQVGLKTLGEDNFKLKLRLIIPRLATI